MKKRIKKNDPMKVKVTMGKAARKEQFGNEWSLPVLALEKVFSYLDWKDLGRAMLVCKKLGYGLRLPRSPTWNKAKD